MADPGVDGNFPWAEEEDHEGGHQKGVEVLKDEGERLGDELGIA